METATNAAGATSWENHRRAEAERFLFILDETTEEFCFQTFSDNGAGDLGAGQLLGTLDKHWDELSRRNARGQGVFVTINAVKPGALRRNDTIERVRAVFADFDSPEAIPEVWPLEPSMLVESSSGKLHAYWLVDGLPLEDFHAAQKAIAAALGSDPVVSDLARVMRMPGFDHMKDKANPHHVAITLRNSGLPYSQWAIKKAFPPAADAAPPREKPTPGDDQVLDALNAKDLVLSEGAKGGWNIICPWESEHTTKSGPSSTMYFPPHTNHYPHAGFDCKHSHCESRTINDLRGFLGVLSEPPPHIREPPLGEEQQRAPTTIDFGDIPLGLRAEKLPVRPWICKGRLLRGTVSVLAGYPGAGKTILEIATCLSVVTGVSYTGEDFVGTGRAWLYANEEAKDELYRRLLASCKYHGIDVDSLHGKMRLSSGYGQSLIIAEERPDGVIQTPVVEPLIQALKDWRCDVFMVDPFVSTHRVNENSNSDIEAVMDKWRYVSSEADCAIELPSHTPKGQHEDPEAMAGNMGAVRGASAIVGAARNVNTLCKMSEQTANKYGIDKADARSLVRLDAAKNNYSKPAEKALWMRLKGVCLDNHEDHEKRDWVGVVERYTEPFVEVEMGHGSSRDKQAALDNLLVAIMSLEIAPGHHVRVVDVMPDLRSGTGRGVAWIKDNVPIVLPKSDTAEGRAKQYSWCYEDRKDKKNRAVCIFRAPK